MEKEKIILLNEIMEEVQCKNCPFSQQCDFLIDNYKKDICQILRHSLVSGGKDNV